MWVLVEDIYKAYGYAPEPEVVSSCIGGLPCSFDMEPVMEDCFRLLVKKSAGETSIDGLVSGPVWRSDLSFGQ